MTAFDRFDPFERRIAGAIDEIAAERQPHYLDDIFRLTARSKQRPRWQFPERWITVNPFALRAAIATVVVVVVVGGFLAFNNPTGPGSTVAPTPSPTFAFVTFPERTWGDWVAEVGDTIPDIGNHDNRIQLSMDWDGGLKLWVQTNAAGRQILQSRPRTAPDGELYIYAQPDAIGCDPGAEGRYSWVRSSDGMFLTLALISDDCPLRSATLARTWVHSLAVGNDGGLGVIYAVEPMVKVTLPTGRRYGGTVGEGWQDIGIDQGLKAFVVVRNPGGYGAPCSTGDTQKGDLAHTTDAFVSYVQALPGANVTTTTTTVGGRSAVRLDVTIDAVVDCPLGEIQAFHAENLADADAFWAFGFGEAQPLYIVQIDATTTYLLWDQGTLDEQQAVIDSISFLDTLPTP
jgi:hypothetical protein